MPPQQNKPRNKKPWPTKAAMVQVYQKQLWGSGEDAGFYSGEGSYLPEIINPYIKAVTNFLKSTPVPYVLCDLGCGDFNIGRNFVQFSRQYYALDIVPALIQRNLKKFQADNLQFLCLDAAKDPLPEGDCVLIRQVLQHLSNQEIIQIIAKIKSFKYIILTEHIPCGEFEPNKDIISGQGIRLKKKSGVNITQPPFNLVSKSSRTLCSVKLQDNKGIIQTILYQLH